MMPVGDDQFLVLHLSLNKPDPFVIGDYPDRVFHTVLIFQTNVWSSPGHLFQDVIDSQLRIFVKHEDLFELSSRVAQQLEAVFFGPRQRPLMGKHDLIRVILQLAQSDKPLSNANFILIRDLESLEVNEQGRLRKLLQNSAGPPFFQAGCGACVNIVLR